MVILLDAVDDALARCEVDDALAADGVGDGATLGGVLAFSLNGDGVVAENVEVAFGIGLLEEFAALGGGGDGIEHAGVGDAGLSMVGDELVSVCRNANAWITRGSGHKSLSVKRSAEVLLLRPAYWALSWRLDSGLEPEESAPQGVALLVRSG